MGMGMDMGTGMETSTSTRKDGGDGRSGEMQIPTQAWKGVKGVDARERLLSMLWELGSSSAQGSWYE